MRLLKRFVVLHITKQIPVQNLERKVTNPNMKNYGGMRMVIIKLGLDNLTIDRIKEINAK